MAIREKVATYIARASDIVFSGRNKSRIILGTDRQDNVNSGYGDESDDPQQGSSTIDLVAGFIDGNIDHVNDKSRIYISEMTNPDEYFQMEDSVVTGNGFGREVEKEPAIVSTSDNLYFKARKNIKIRNENITILISEDGNIEIECQDAIKIQSGESVITLNPNGQISIGAESGDVRRIITEQDLCVGIDPTTGAPIISKFIDAPGVDAAQGGLVNNNNVSIII